MNASRDDHEAEASKIQRLDRELSDLETREARLVQLLLPGTLDDGPLLEEGPNLKIVRKF